MNNRVTPTIAIRKEKANKRGECPIILRCQVNGSRVVISLSISATVKAFDEARQLVKQNYPNADLLNSILHDAKTKVLRVLADANAANVRLTKETFEQYYKRILSNHDFIAWWENHLEERRGAINHSTYKAQRSMLGKFKQFRSSLPFDMLTLGLLQDYERFLIKRGNTLNTVATAMRNLKCYVNAALADGYEFKSPFERYRIRSTSGRIVFLSVDELQKLLKLYDNRLLAENLHNSLIVFIVQAFTSLRISDAKLLNENWLNGNELQFMPYKTRRYQKTVSFGLSKVAKRLVDDFIQHKREVKIKAEPKINLDLKLIAAMAGINKRITTHTARHTFATVFLRLGGTVETLREIMGHTNIMTTMQYVHLIDHQKTEQMGNFDNQFQ